MDDKLILGMAAPALAGGFMLPEGFTIPDDTKEGDTFEALVTLKLGSGGMAMPTAVDGIPVSAEAEDEEIPDDEADEAMPFADRVESRMRPMNPDEAPVQQGDY